MHETFCVVILKFYAYKHWKVRNLPCSFRDLISLMSEYEKQQV